MNRLKAAVVATALCIVLETVLSWIVWSQYQTKEQMLLERHVEVFHDLYESTLASYRKVTRIVFDELIDTPEVIALMTRANDADPEVQDAARDALYELLLPVYDKLREMNIRQLHFHLPDSTSFLRFHKPGKYGDNLQGIRYSLELANREQRYVEGFEEGRVYNGFRHVFPLADAYGNHLGTVEISLSFHALRSDIEAITGNHIDFMVKKSIVDRKVWKEERQNYFVSMLSGEYLHEHFDEALYREHAHDDVTLDIAERAVPMMHDTREFALYADGYSVAFLPVNNVEGEAGAAYLVSYAKTDMIVKLRNDAWLLWGLSTFGAVLISVLAYLLMQKISQIGLLATRDALTGLYNRHSMTVHIEDELARYSRTDEAFSIIYFDIDDFKQVNDRYGHESGDRVLQSLATILSENLRRSDAVGRWGGEEFIVCLPNTGGDDAVTAAEKLRHAVASHDFNLSEPVTCSFGVATCRKEERMDLLISRADEALYTAKAEGKNRVVKA